MAENTNILAGVGAIVNPQNVKTGVNVDELAKSLINDGLISDTRALQSEEDPAEKFNAELAHAAKKLGIEFEDIEPSSRGTSTKKKPSISFRAGTDSSSALSRGREDDYGGGREASSSSDDDADGEDGEEDFHHSRDENAENRENSTDQVSIYRSPSGGYQSSISRGRDSSGDFHKYTQEQIRRKHIENVIGSSAGGFGARAGGFGDGAGESYHNDYFSREREAEAKADALGEISLLLSDLEEEGANLKGIRDVDSNSSLADVRSTLMALRYRSDSMRCASTAGEVLMLAAKAVEKFFNGEREMMGYRPNMSGWSNTVAPKIRRLKPSMGRVMHDVMEERGVGPISRLAMEILPSAVMYGVTRSQQIGEPGLFRDGDN